MAEKVEETNILIAEFMGFRYGDTYAGKRWTWSEDSYPYTTSALAFNSKWDWLMPVLKHIESKGFIVQVTLCLAGSCQIWNHKGNRFFSENNEPILAAWETVIQFINWYNSQKLAA